MGNELRLKVFFPPGGELDALCQERRRVQSCKDRADRHYETLLQEMDDRIAELRAAQSEVAS